MPCLSALERFVNTPNELPLLVGLSVVHYQFQAIHPFEDGNGRVGRLLISLLLESERALPYPVLCLSAYWDRFRSEYYDRLLAVSQAGEWNGGIVFCLRGVTEQAIDAVVRAGQLQRTRKTVDDLPCTEEFERLYESFVQRTGLNLNRHDFGRALASQRKAARG